MISRLLRRSKRHLTWLVVGVLAVALGSMGASLVHGRTDSTDAEGLPTGQVTYAYVSDRPAAHIEFPSGRLLQRLGQSETSAQDLAYAGGVFVSDKSPGEIDAWYHDQLTANGWQPWNGAGLLDTMLSQSGYQRGMRERFILAIDNPRTLALTLGTQVPLSGTIYEFRYAIVPYSSGVRNSPRG